MITAYTIRTRELKAMTNRKIKDYHKNKPIFDAVYENYKNLLRLLIVLNRCYPKDFYPKKLYDWLETFEGTCNWINKYDKAGVYEDKVAELCEDYSIDANTALLFVAKNNKEITNPRNAILLAENIKMALYHTCKNYGIGEKRLKVIEAALVESDIKDPEKELAKINIEMNTEEVKVTDIDWRDLRPEKQKALTQGELKAAYHELEGLKAYQDAMRGKT